MDVKFRNYSNKAGITEDYYKVRSFFIKLGYTEYTYARWDWMASHGYLDKFSIRKIGLWEDNNEVIGIATFDTVLCNAYCLALPKYHSLREEMLRYAEANLSSDKGFGIVIADRDISFQDIAVRLGYVATENKD
ncbi:MAG: hypothetical protein EWM47_13380 [Anaerolineaceae bacterium]|nr:MAG: hypothetical protein EWM47_13380 [Anaerolineaceae bacterium]